MLMDDDGADWVAHFFSFLTVQYSTRTGRMGFSIDFARAKAYTYVYAYCMRSTVDAMNKNI